MNRHIALLAIPFIALSACGEHSSVQKTVRHEKISRDEFTRLVMGQPDNVVLAKFGQPYLDNNYAGQLGILWTYRGITFDPASGKQDEFATVVFEHGVVAKVVFK